MLFTKKSMSNLDVIRLESQLKTGTETRASVLSSWANSVYFFKTMYSI